MKIYSLLTIILLPLYITAQEQPSSGMEQQIENIAENAEDEEATDDSWLQQMEYLIKNPLDLNTAGEADLKELKILNGLQVDRFLLYRNLLGKLISLYELQAVPGWDIAAIQKLIPYVTITATLSVKEDLRKRFRKGDYTITSRISGVLEKAKGYLIKDSSKSFYAGDPIRLLLRYKYQYKNLLQYGFTMAKDAGESWRGPGVTGFDYFSFHFFTRNHGIIKALALGDYTINMGQGLVQWQGLAFGKGADMMHAKRQAPVLSPYNSAGAFYFNRGAAVTLQHHHWQLTSFVSLRKLDANIEQGSFNGGDIASSIHLSGYHRTQTEKKDRHTLQQFGYGANIMYKRNAWHVGLNTVQYHFDKHIQKEDKPYNLYALSGKSWGNSSIDYSFTFRNIHFFGETAIDKKLNTALINGLLISAGSMADFTVLHRVISARYQSFFGNAFTVNTNPTNEEGIYAGISLKPANTWKMDAFADMFRFPWLKYRVDAPSAGKDYFVQITYKPSKQTELYTRYRTQQKPVNNKTENSPMNEVVPFLNSSWRTQINHQVNTTYSIRQRFELLWYKTERSNPEKGFLLFFDIFYKPKLSRTSGNVRLAYFESDSYNSRLYAYENDVLYYYAVPVFYDKGSRYYVNLQYRVNKILRIWLKWSQTFYNNKNTIGSGLDEINGKKKSEIRMLFSASF